MEVSSTGSNERKGNEHLKLLDTILHVTPYLSIRSVCYLKCSCRALDRVLSATALYEVNILLSNHDHTAEVPLCVRLMQHAIFRYPNISFLSFTCDSSVLSTSSVLTSLFPSYAQHQQQHPQQQQQQQQQQRGSLSRQEQEEELMRKLQCNNVTSLLLKSSLVYSKTLDYIIPIFTRLRELKMDGLMLIDDFIPFFVKSLPLLECMEARRMFNLWKPQIVSSSSSSSSSSSCALRIIRFVNCPRLVGLRNIPPSLELLDLSGSSIDGINFNNLMQAIKGSSLTSLVLQRCRKLAYTIDQQIQQDGNAEKWLYMKDLHNIVHIDVRYCQHIKHVMISDCPQLRDFQITYCYGLESLVLRKTIIKRLELTMLENLKNLKITDCGMLNYLDLQGCINLNDMFGADFANNENDDHTFDNHVRRNLLSTLPLVSEVQCSNLRAIRWIDGSKKKFTRGVWIKENNNVIINV